MAAAAGHSPESSRTFTTTFLPFPLAIGVGSISHYGTQRKATD
jgi:hypothetical protein